MGRSYDNDPLTDPAVLAEAIHIGIVDAPHLKGILMPQVGDPLHRRRDRCMGQKGKKDRGGEVASIINFT